VGVSEKTLIDMAVRSMGLDELTPFKPEERVIEYLLQDPAEQKLIRQSLSRFSEETASESPAPGGGSISAYVGTLGISLATMVANLSAHKKGWDERWEEFSDWAEKGEGLRKQLLLLVDADTRAFDSIMAAFGLPKSTDAEKNLRTQAIQTATKLAMEVPLQVMRLCLQSMDVIEAMANNGNPNSVSDAGVGALCARTAVLGAFMNVRINAAGCTDAAFVRSVLEEGSQMEKEAVINEERIRKVVDQQIDKL
jgi:glutamate formiminotransferase/formiminotetrahydrofolate cyclodeaminase